jgi:hypothetical protein
LEILMIYLHHPGAFDPSHCGAVCTEIREVELSLALRALIEQLTKRESHKRNHFVGLEE